MSKLGGLKQVVGVVVTAAALVSVQAGAASYSETVVTSKGVRAESVSYDDLDLSSAKGQEHLYYRLHSAARRVCGSTDVRIAGNVRVAAENQDCFERALNDALSQVNAGQVATTD